MYTRQTFDISFETTNYNIKYVTNGGTLYSKNKDEQQGSVELTEETFEAGTKLSQLPSPGKEGAVFLGWCYDSTCTDYVSSEDRLLSDVVSVSYTHLLSDLAHMKYTQELELQMA